MRDGSFRSAQAGIEVHGYLSPLAAQGIILCLHPSPFYRSILDLIRIDPSCSQPELLKTPRARRMSIREHRVLSKRLREVIQVSH